MTLPPRNPRLIDLEHLKPLIGSGEVDTVVIAFTDMQGRLQGKRLHGRTSSTWWSSRGWRAATTCWVSTWT